jgi:hypothetical protein
VPRHNIVFLGARPVNLTFGGYQGASFYETAAKTHIMGIVVCFRNDAVYGETINPIHNARAHLKFFNHEGIEIGTGYSRSFWLGEKADLFDLVPGGESGCVIAIIASAQKITVPLKHRTPTSWGESLRDEFIDLEHLPHIAEVSLLDANNQLLLEPIRMELSSPVKGALTAKSLPPPAKPAELVTHNDPPKTSANLPTKRSEGADSTKHTRALKKPWTRDQKIGAVIATFALIAIVVAIATPEIRRKIGLEKYPSAIQDKMNLEKLDKKTNSPAPNSQAPEKQPPVKEGLAGKHSENAPAKNEQINNAPGGIAISGGTVSNPTVNNFGPPPAVIRWIPVARTPPQDARFPRSYIELALDHSLESAKFAVVCDKPCEAVSHEPPMGVSQVNYGTIPDQPDVAVFAFISPNPFPPDTKTVLGVQSKDKQPVKIVQVTTLKIDK